MPEGFHQHKTIESNIHGEMGEPRRPAPWGPRCYAAGVILFKPEHVEPILSGRKTQTRRRWKRRRMVPGSIHQARTRLFGEPFAALNVLRVWQEAIGQVSEADARAEGYPGRESFLDAFARINGQVDPDEIVWCVEFTASSPAD